MTISADRVANDALGCPFYPILSIIMKNDGDDTALITAVDLKVLQIWYPDLMSAINEAVFPSATYSICLNPARIAPYEVSKLAIPSVSVPGHGGAAQIDVSLCGDQKTALENIYSTHVWLTYDGKNETTPKKI
jgi:hypothetical protein